MRSNSVCSQHGYFLIIQAIFYTLYAICLEMIYVLKIDFGCFVSKWKWSNIFHMYAVHKGYDIFCNLLSQP